MFTNVAYLRNNPMRSESSVLRDLTVRRMGKNNYSISGPLMIENVPGAWTDMLHIFSENQSAILDMSRVTRMDSAGLAMLVRLISEAHQRSLNIYFKNIPEQMQAVVKLNHLCSNLPLYINQDARV